MHVIQFNKKKTFKEQVKDWWTRNKRVIEVGAVCGALGIMYGFIKGCQANDKLWIDGLAATVKAANNDSDASCDEHDLTEDNCDDPELLELVEVENESI